MTSYNREKFIGSAIESVLNSTYTNFELIIVDDHSNDHTVSIEKTYAARDQRIKLYINDKNLGDYPNRNKAASYATGEYLKYIDSDDYIYPWGLQMLVTMMEQFPESGWGLCSLIQDISRPFPFELTPREAYEYHYRGPGLFHKAPLSSIIRRKVFDEVKGFSSQRMVSDSEMWHKLALKYKVLLMPDGIVWNREHNMQEVKSRLKYLVEYEKIMIDYLRNKDCPLDQKVANDILRNMKSQNMKDLIIAAVKLNPKLVWMLWRVWHSY